MEKTAEEYEKEKEMLDEMFFNAYFDVSMDIKELDDLVSDKKEIEDRKILVNTIKILIKISLLIYIVNLNQTNIDLSQKVDRSLNEKVNNIYTKKKIFYHKVIIELGALGLLIVIIFFMIIIHEIVLSIRNIKDKQVSVFCSLVLALFILMIIMASKGGHIFTKYPSNLLFYLFFGIAIKLRFLNLDNKK